MEKRNFGVGKTPNKVAKVREIKPSILVVGGGGREHAIITALRKSDGVGKIYVAPGNAGMGAEQTGLSATDIDGIVAFVDSHADIELTVVASDDPLALGAVDRLTEAGHRAFGPTKAAAKLEWSKAYAKAFMQKYGIPTAESVTFQTAEQAEEYVKTCELPIVLKADGLALGKGVIICETREDAENGVAEIMTDKKFGAAGNVLVAERFLKGYEVSLFVFTDGKDYKVLPTSCDYKRAHDGNEGLNTGGMGAYSPCPRFTKEFIEKTEREIVVPTIAGMIKEGAPFKGVLYFGLMVDGDDVRVLEYNARFGDPETQSILPLLDSDLYEIMNATIDGTIANTEVKWKDLKSINVVLASGGYPVSYGKGYEITGLDEVRDAAVYFAGVKAADGKLVTSGGRVLCVQACAKDFEKARKTVYDNIKKIKFTDCYYRSDIGKNLE